MSARRLAALLGSCALCALFVPAGVGAAACSATAEVIPQPAVVGQQILHRVRIERSADVQRIEWIDPPRFADFRAEWLPGGPERSRRRADGTTTFVREELRALFPLRAGDLVVSAARLACGSGGGGARASTEVVSLPALRVRGVRAPGDGQPADWAGLVGPVRVRLGPLPDAIRLGETLHVSITLRGASNLWDEPETLDRSALAAGPVPVEVFGADPDLHVERGSRLELRRSDRIDLVPRATGSVQVRTREVVWYDPEQRRYARTPARSATVRVLPASASDPETPPTAR